MDDEQTAGYKEPCAVCAAVSWGVSDEGRFYCRSCHNVIERTREVVDPNFVLGSARVSTIGRGARTKRLERGRQWAVCEGFQFILRNQADALVRLGVGPGFKDAVLCHLWRIYLQRSRQAYTSSPARTARFRLRRPDSDSDGAAEASVVSASETDGDTNPSSGAGSTAGSSAGWSQCSGSLDAADYLTPRLRRRSHGVMSMKKTLALIHLALVWTREPLTLSDLLRLVNEGHVPYLNAYEDLPDEMKLEGKDALIFRVESVPPHRVVHREARALLLFLQLPAFPPISRQSLLHPSLLSLRYLLDANLPDELHPWVCRVSALAGLTDPARLTFDRRVFPVLPRYDLQAAALVIVAMKLLFGLDDHTEWDLSNEAGDVTGDGFSLRRWFRLVQDVLSRAQQRRDHDVARKQWVGKKPLHTNNKKKSVVLKSKRISEQVQKCFEKLSSRPPGSSPSPPSSFRFQWGDQDSADGPSLHHQKLGGVLVLRGGVPAPCNASYWHPAVTASQMCSRLYQEVEASLPRSFVWLLQLFCFLLDVKPAYLLQEVLRVETRVINRTRRRSRTRTRTRIKTSTKTRTRTSTRAGRGRTSGETR